MIKGVVFYSLLLLARAATFSSSTIPGQLERMAWITEQSVLVLTSTRHVYVSLDGGARFTPLAELSSAPSRISTPAFRDTCDGDNETGCVESVFIRSEGDSNRIFLIGGANSASRPEKAVVWVLSPAFELLATIRYIPLIHLEFHPDDPMLILGSAQLGYGRLDAMYASQDDGLTWQPLSSNGSPLGVLAVGGMSMARFAVGGESEDPASDRLSFVAVTAPGASKAFSFSTPTQLLDAIADAPPAVPEDVEDELENGVPKSSHARSAVAAADGGASADSAAYYAATPALGVPPTRRCPRGRKVHPTPADWLEKRLGLNTTAAAAVASFEAEVAAAFDDFATHYLEHAGDAAAGRDFHEVDAGGDVGGVSESSGVGGGAARGRVAQASGSSDVFPPPNGPIVLLTSLSSLLFASASLGGSQSRALRLTLPPTPWPKDKPVEVTVQDKELATKVAYIAGVGRFFFLAMFYTETRRFELRLSHDNARTLRRLIMPHNQAETSYRVLGSDDGMLYVHIDHVDRNPLQPCDEQPRTYGSVYRADAESARLITVMPGVRRVCSHVDWYSVRGVSGAAVANVLRRPSLSCVYCSSVTECNVACSYVSVITWDHGQSWYQLSTVPNQTPMRIRGGGVTLDGGRGGASVDPDTFLHVQSPIDNPDTVLPLMSRGAAPGVVTLLANRGVSLTTASDEVELFLSRDAGRSWKSLGIGRRSALVLDQGGLIVHSKRGAAVAEVKASYDAGGDFETLTNPKPQPMEVLAPVPGKAGVLSRYAVGFSTSVNGSTVLTRVDFAVSQDTLPSCSTDALSFHADTAERVALTAADGSGVHVRRRRPGRASGVSGYEKWQMPGHDRCSLGRERTLIRRVKGVACWGVPISKMTLFGDQCPCDPVADFDCALGYTRTDDGVCNEDEGALGGDADGLCDPATHTQRTTRGYMRLPGDECVGGEFDPIVKPCGWLNGRSRFMVVVLGVLALAGGCFAAYHFYLVNPRCRGKVDSFLEQYCPSVAQYLAANEVMSVPQFHGRLDSNPHSLGSESDDDFLGPSRGDIEPATGVSSSTPYRAAAMLDSDSDDGRGPLAAAAAPPVATAAQRRASATAAAAIPAAAAAVAAAPPANAVQQPAPTVAAPAPAPRPAAPTAPPEDDDDIFGL